MIKFEKVSRFKDVDFAMPVRKTKYSAGYDMVVAEDKVIPPYYRMFNILTDDKKRRYLKPEEASIVNELIDKNDFSLAEMATLTKITMAQPFLVSTGIKCKLDPGTYLELSMRSSTPLKQWLIMANSVGIIDADYYNNPDNEGEIFFQLINLSPYPIKLKKGDIIGQGIIKRYLVTEDDNATGLRTGGFGSTNG